jgi:hypothetical protein
MIYIVIIVMDKGDSCLHFYPNKKELSEATQMLDGLVRLHDKIAVSYKHYNATDSYVVGYVVHSIKNHNRKTILCFDATLKLGIPLSEWIAEAKERLI